MAKTTATEADGAKKVKQGTDHAHVIPLPVEDLAAVPGNRTVGDDAAFKELVKSIEAVGVLVPLRVRPPQGGKHEIVYGERRWRAAQKAGLTTVPCEIAALTDEEAEMYRAIENLHRENPHPMDELALYERMQKLEATRGPKELAALVGKTERYVTRRLALQTLTPKTREAFKAGKIGLEVAQALATVHAAADQERGLVELTRNGAGEASGDDAREWIERHVFMRLSAVP